eukprot:13067-Heterococcus_DN1.PRE.2
MSSLDPLAFHEFTDLHHVHLLDRLPPQLEYRQYLQADREKMARAAKLSQDMKQDLKPVSKLHHIQSKDKPEPET